MIKLSISINAAAMQLVYLYLILQTESTDPEKPNIKKSLFPLFSSKNNLKHSSSLKKLPVVNLPMVLFSLKTLAIKH